MRSTENSSHWLLLAPSEVVFRPGPCLNERLNEGALSLTCLYSHSTHPCLVAAASLLSQQPLGCDLPWFSFPSGLTWPRSHSLMGPHLGDPWLMHVMGNANFKQGLFELGSSLSEDLSAEMSDVRWMWREDLHEMGLLVAPSSCHVASYVPTALGRASL